MGRILNAAGHTMAGLAARGCADAPLCFVDYKDKDGGVHPNISHYPVIALKAKNSNQIKKIRDEAKDKSIAFTDFTDTMTLGSTADQLSATAATGAEDINYLGLCLFGKTDDLKALTGKLSLYK